MCLLVDFFMLSLFFLVMLCLFFMLMWFFGIFLDFSFVSYLIFLLLLFCFGFNSCFLSFCFFFLDIDVFFMVLEGFIWGLFIFFSCMVFCMLVLNISDEMSL